MQPHVNLSIRFRTHFRSIGLSRKRNLENYHRAVHAIEKKYRVLGITRHDAEVKIKELKHMLKEGIRIAVD